MLVIVTNPKNSRYLKIIKEQAAEKLAEEGFKVISGLDSIAINYNEDMPEKHVVGQVGKKEKFVDWGNSDWEVYFGLTDPIYGPYFRLFETGGSSVWRGR